MNTESSLINDNLPQPRRNAVSFVDDRPKLTKSKPFKDEKKVDFLSLEMNKALKEKRNNNKPANN